MYTYMYTQASGTTLGAIVPAWYCSLNYVKLHVHVYNVLFYMMGLMCGKHGLTDSESHMIIQSDFNSSTLRGVRLERFVDVSRLSCDFGIHSSVHHFHLYTT